MSKYRISEQAVQALQDELEAYESAIMVTANSPQFQDKPTWQMDVRIWQERAGWLHGILRDIRESSGIRLSGYIGQ